MLHTVGGLSIHTSGSRFSNASIAPSTNSAMGTAAVPREQVTVRPVKMSGGRPSTPVPQTWTHGKSAAMPEAIFDDVSIDRTIKIDPAPNRPRRRRYVIDAESKRETAPISARHDDDSSSNFFYYSK